MATCAAGRYAEERAAADRRLARALMGHMRSVEVGEGGTFSFCAHPCAVRVMCVCACALHHAER